jgi:hypothetical protein
MDERLVTWGMLAIGGIALALLDRVIRIARIPLGLLILLFLLLGFGAFQLLQPVVDLQKGVWGTLRGSYGLPAVLVAYVFGRIVLGKVWPKREKAS